MKPMKVLITDDEADSRKVLRNMLVRYFPQFTEILEADTVEKGRALIRVHRPHLTFLDVVLPDGTGFDVLEAVSQLSCKVIFVTAYDEYAVKAFRVGAVDYLLKPVHHEQFIEAVNQALETTYKGITDFKWNELYNLLATGKNIPKIILRTSEAIYATDVEDIIRCEADGGYTHFYLDDGRRITVSRPLKSYQELLPPDVFFRVHQSHLVNLRHFDHYKKKDGGLVVMKDGSLLPVSIRKKEDLMKVLNRLDNSIS